MSKLLQIRSEVKEWASYNFGINQSKANTGVVLHQLAPALGIIEELGELSQAVRLHNHDGIKDAVGDIMIYFMDFSWRDNMSDEELTEVFEASNDAIVFLPLSEMGGEFAHLVLKRHQGIRGYQDDTFYKTERRRLLNHMMTECGMILHKAFGHEENLVSVLDEVWTNIVKKRDWKKNAQGG